MKYKLNVNEPNGSVNSFAVRDKRWGLVTFVSWDQYASIASLIVIQKWRELVSVVLNRIYKGLSVSDNNIKVTYILNVLVSRMSRDMTASIDSITIMVKGIALVMPESAHQTTIVINLIVVCKSRGFFMLVWEKKTSSFYYIAIKNKLIWLII